MTINDTVTRPSGTLIVEFDPETRRFGRDHVAIEAERLTADDPADAGNHRPHPQRFLDDGVEVPVVPRLLYLREYLGRVQQQVERPCEPGRGRLMAGEQQRQQLVADLLVREALAVLVLGEQQR